MAQVLAAESNTPAKRARAPKVIDHLELHRKMDGGHIVKHVYTDYEHKPLEVQFNKAGKAKGGEHIIAHLMKHGGLPEMTGAEGNGESQTQEEEVE